MNSFDSSIVSFLNDLAGHWKTFDELMVFISDSPLVKGGLIMACLWWVWFRRESDGPNRRDYVVATVLAGIVAVLVARGLAHVLPFRDRPMVDAAQHFVRPHKFTGRELNTWSSFPSDHAVLFFSLATGLYLAHRRLGIAAFVWVTVIVCFPRLYLGIHWPTDSHRRCAHRRRARLAGYVAGHPGRDPHARLAVERVVAGAVLRRNVHRHVRGDEPV